jgi:hypothetical protein
VRALKAAGEGKPLWLWGVGLPFMAAPGRRLRLRLSTHRLFSKTETMWLEYDVTRAAASA